MAAPLPALPEELIEQVVGYLHLDDLNRFRLTCKSISLKSLHFFGSAHFHTLKTNLTRRSLEKLDLISKHPMLRQYVKTLQIDREYSGWPGVYANGYGMTWQRSSDGTLLPDQASISYFRDMLRRFTNCWAISILCDCDDEYTTSDHISHSDVLAIFQIIMSETQLPSLKAFHVILGRITSCRVDSRRLHCDLEDSPVFERGWSRIEDLSLELTVAPETLEWLLDLIKKAPRLRRLSLRVPFAKSYRHLNQADAFDEHTFLSRLAKLSQQPCFSILEDLSLIQARTTKDDLLNLLLSTKTRLRSLKIYNIALQFAEDWISVLNCLRRGFQSLSAVCLQFLTFDGPDPCRVTFPGLEDWVTSPELNRYEFSLLRRPYQGGKPVLGVEYSGSDTADALNIIHDSMSVVHNSPD